MSKLKSIMENRTKGNLTGGQKSSCYDCLHVLPGMQGDEVTCEIYTYKYERYRLRKLSTVPPSFADGCDFFKAMTPEQKDASERKFKEFYKRLG